MKWIILSCLAVFISCMNNQKINNKNDLSQISPSKEAPNSFKIKVSTSKGVFFLTCHKDWAPLGANRLYHLVNIGFFNDVRFFRYVPNFVVQFGISGDPQTNLLWKDAKISDDPVKNSNLKGTLSFATAGPHTRTTQLFINLVDNQRLDSMGFSPLCTVSEGMEIISKLYSEYGEAPSYQQMQIESEGNKFLNNNFPKLDYIIKAEIIE